ncbi:hypothetical protein Tco_0469131 [Tanacetum coccineum]
MDQIIKRDSVQETNDHKRKLEDKGNIVNNNNYQNNYNNNNRNDDYHRQQNRRQETFKIYTATNGYTGNRPLCERCTLHHIVRILLPNGKILEVQGERPEKDLRFLSCIKSNEKKLKDILIVYDFLDVFSDDLSGLPLVCEIEFYIDLIPGALPVVRLPYQLAPSEMLELSNKLTELQDKGFIRPSHSSWRAQVLFVKKKDGALRMCIDYRELNKSSFGLSPAKSQLIGPIIVQETTQKIMQIKERLKTVRDCQKNYADKRRKPLEFNVGDFRPIAYRLRLPHELSSIHDMFNVSNLKKCLTDTILQVPLEEIEIDDKLHFIEKPVGIVNKEVKKLKRKRIPIVKVCWNSQRGAEFTWEREDQFKAKYPHLFATTSSAPVAT